MNHNSLNIKITVTATLILGACLLAIFIYFKPQVAVYAGGTLGLLLAVINFVFMVRILEGLLKPKARKGPLVLLLILKLIFLIAVVVLAFWVFKVDVIAFAMGYLSLVVVLTVQGIVTSPGELL